MSPEAPSFSTLKELSERHGFGLSSHQLEQFQEFIGHAMESYQRIDQLPSPELPVEGKRHPGRRPSQEGNPYNAWYRKTSIRERDSGPLSDKTVALKDNILLAGVPMSFGSRLWDGFVPHEDATVVRRLLEAGAEITGKAVCEDHCTSGGSHTSFTGPVRNPHDAERSTGGSSSGSAALVSGGHVDAALGTDTAGSIRIPSSWSGVVGLKPSFGLVPFTGVLDTAQTLDHVGPLAQSVEEVARFLGVLAGPEPLDPRGAHSPEVPSKPYTDQLVGHGENLRIGILEEGFGWSESEQDVDEAVRSRAREWREVGADVEEASVPLHRHALHVWRAIVCEELASRILHGHGVGSGWKGHYLPSVARASGRITDSEADQFPPNLKLLLMIGEYVRSKFHNTYYAKAQNLRRRITRAYEKAFQRFDLLVLPTTPTKARPLPESDADMASMIFEALGSEINNTCPFNVTGHPALNLPCGTSEGLPVGMMLVGRMGDEATLLRAAHALEQEMNLSLS